MQRDSFLLGSIHHQPTSIVSISSITMAPRLACGLGDPFGNSSQRFSDLSHWVALRARWPGNDR